MALSPEERLEHRRESGRRYRRSLKGQATLKRYRQRPEVKASRRDYDRRYAKSPHRKENNRRYRQSSRGKETRRRNRQRPEAKAKQREASRRYRRSLQGKATRRLYEQRPDVREKEAVRQRDLQQANLAIPKILRNAAVTDALRSGIGKAADGTVT